MNKAGEAALSFEHFSQELGQLVEIFGRNLAHYKGSDYDEASLRQEFLNPFFRALGWDMENKAGDIPKHREVEIESRTDIGGQKKRADYLFRTDRIDRFICEAKKPAEELRKHAFQAKRYAWNKNVFLGVLTDFEETHLFIVGSKARADEPEVGLWKTWHFQQYPLVAQEIWDLLSRPAVASGSIDKVIDALPRKAPAKGKARQQWLIKPDRSRALDAEFLNFLDESRRTLAQDLLKNNDRADLLEDNRLNEAVQRILDRLLFLRICEDRDIDTGIPLALILRSWRERSAHPVPRKVREAGLWANDDAGRFTASDPRPPAWPLWKDVVGHFKALDRRPPSHIPFFNGNLFKEHFSETLRVGDEWLAGFLDDVSDEESPYLFNVIPVEILGTIYERFLGKTVRPQGRGVTIEEKPEVRKAGGVYYTPRYIVNYIVEQTVGKLLEDQTPEKSLELRLLDPACGSGSFLIRAYERMCEHWQIDLTRHPSKRRRPLCWVDEASGDVHLTTDLKRKILTANIYGVDLDPGAVEVTQLSLYLKMLEGETRHTLAAERDLFGSDIALLPPLQDNIKCGNSLIASDFSLVPEDLVRVRAFDWDVGFAAIMKAGGFDAVIGNPPYGATILDSENAYFKSRYSLQQYQIDTYITFLERSLGLVRQAGLIGMIIPNTWLLNVQMPRIRQQLVTKTTITEIVHFASPVFEQATVDTEILIIQSTLPRDDHLVCISLVDDNGVWEKFKTAQNRWQKLSGGVINIVERPEIIALADRLRSLKKLAAFYKVTQGTKPFQVGKGKPPQTRAVVNAKPFVSETPKDSTFKPLLRGSLIHRYVIEWKKNSWISFGDWLAEPRYSASHDASEKIVIRQTGDSLMATLDNRQFIVRDNLYTIIAVEKSASLRMLLGLLNSNLLGWYYQNVVNPEAGEALAQVKRTHLDVLPIPDLDLRQLADRARHDKLVELVDKMLALTPKLRAAKTDKAREALQNAVTKTDRQIDALVYELYGLTPEEIALVERERT